jgi:uncharacterized membrane protein YGL010W
MKNLHDHLASYAAYHRDPRNIATHFVGIPMIVVAVATLLSRPVFLTLDIGPGGALALSPAVLAIAATCAFYLRLDRRYFVAMTLLMGLAGYVGARLAAQPFGVWLGAGLGLFVVGWIIQFVGHFFEGRKPAFVDDLVGLIVGPLFVVAEAGFAVGFRDEVKAEIEKRTGPVRRDPHRQTA